MRTVHKVSANAPCPCGKLSKKYKNCCRGKVDWETLPFGEAPRHLSIRGKNMLFLNLAYETLQLDKAPDGLDLPDFKRAFTATAVQKIHETVAFVWPDGDDLRRALQDETESTSGLYIGVYDSDRVRRGVARHSLYSDRILLIDPLMYPGRMRAEMDPSLRPELHRSTTLRWVSLWFQMAPWIEEGLVAFVRPLSDFDFNLFRESIAVTKSRFERHPELTELLQIEAKEQVGTPEYDIYTEQFLLSMPDAQIMKMVRDLDPNATDQQIASVVAHYEKKRDEHPYYVHPEDSSTPHQEIFQISSGVNYEQGKMIATQTKSYVMTDIRARWREIEIDRDQAGIQVKQWSPFAKAFHGLPFKFLDDVPLEAALTIRKDGRLESLRLFLRKVWGAASQGSPFDDANVVNLAAELDEKVREAEVEWRKIDRDLIKLVTAEASAALLAAGPLIAAGQAAFLAGAVLLAGTTNVIGSSMRRKEYKIQYPAGFFVDLKQGQFS
jgi:hypothetical protein